MMRIELYVDRNDRLTLDIYPSINNETVMQQLKGKECYEFIKELCSSKINQITQSSNKEDIKIKSNDFIFTVNEYNKVFQRNGTKVIRDTINDFLSKEKLKQVKLKKVTRKNKYIRRKIIAGLLVATLLASVAITTVQGIKDGNEIIPYYSETLNITNDNVETTEVTTTEEETTEIETTEVTTTEEETVEETKFSSNTDFVSLNYENRYNSDKAKKTRAYYTDAIKKYSDMYGIDYELMIAIATQERGEHSEVRDPGGAIGLLQIEDFWNNKELSAYNYQTNEYETIIVEEAKLSDVFYNIKVGCMIFQTSLNYMKYNIPLAIQCYNMGCGNMEKILNSCSINTGKSVEEILKDPTNLDWMKYRYEAKGGDKQYFENVSSFLDPSAEINIYNGDEEINMNIKTK